MVYAVDCVTFIEKSITFESFDRWIHRVEEYRTHYNAQHIIIMMERY